MYIKKYLGNTSKTHIYLINICCNNAVKMMYLCGKWYIKKNVKKNTQKPQLYHPLHNYYLHTAHLPHKCNPTNTTNILYNYHTKIFIHFTTQMLENTTQSHTNIQTHLPYIYHAFTTSLLHNSCTNPCTHWLQTYETFTTCFQHD